MTSPKLPKSFGKRAAEFVIIGGTSTLLNLFVMTECALLIYGQATVSDKKLEQLRGAIDELRLRRVSLKTGLWTLAADFLNPLPNSDVTKEVASAKELDIASVIGAFLDNPEAMKELIEVSLSDYKADPIPDDLLPLLNNGIAGKIKFTDMLRKKGLADPHGMVFDGKNPGDKIQVKIAYLELLADLGRNEFCYVRRFGQIVSLPVTLSHTRTNAPSTLSHGCFTLNTDIIRIEKLFGNLQLRQPVFSPAHRLMREKVGSIVRQKLQEYFEKHKTPPDEVLAIKTKLHEKLPYFIRKKDLAPAKSGPLHKAWDWLIHGPTRGRVETKPQPKSAPRTP